MIFPVFFVIPVLAELIVYLINYIHSVVWIYLICDGYHKHGKIC